MERPFTEWKINIALKMHGCRATPGGQVRAPIHRQPTRRDVMCNRILLDSDGEMMVRVEAGTKQARRLATDRLMVKQQTCNDVVRREIWGLDLNYGLIEENVGGAGWMVVIVRLRRYLEVLIIDNDRTGCGFGAGEGTTCTGFGMIGLALR